MIVGTLCYLQLPMLSSMNMIYDSPKKSKQACHILFITLREKTGASSPTNASNSHAYQA